MSRPAPASITVAKPSDFILPEFDVEPLVVALENVNAVYLYHQPAMLQGLPADEYSGGTEGATYLLPVIPSVDGLPYTFQLATTAATDVDRTYYESSDATISGATYSSIGTDSGTSGATGIITDGPYTIAAATRHIKIVYATAATIFPEAICIYPTPAASVPAPTDAGFIAYDDGLYDTATGAPMHKELLDRCRKSTLAVWHDRKQCGYSLFCNTDPDGDEGETHKISIGSGESITMPIARMRLPGYAASARLTAKAIGITAGATVTDGITITLKGKDSAVIQLDASGAVESGSASVTPDGDDLARFVDVSLVLSGESIAAFELHSLIIWPEAA